MMKHGKKFYPRRICNYKKPELVEVGDLCGLPIFAVFRQPAKSVPTARLRPVRILPAATANILLKWAVFPVWPPG